MPAWSKVVVSGSSAVLSSLALDTDLAVAHGGTGASTLTSGYALLGNGTSAPQMINSTADSTLLVGNGSTMVAETGATLRTSIGVAIGSDVQAYDAQLADVAGLAVTNGNFIVGNGSNFVAESGATARTSLGVAIGSDVQAYDAQLADVAGLAVTDSGFIVGNGSNFVLETGNTLRTSMGVGTGNSPTFTNLYTSGNISGSAASTGSFGRVQASVIGGNSPIRIEGAVTYADDASIDFGSINMTNLDVDSGTIDGATIATSDITVGSGKTLNVSAGTLTLAANQISGDKVEGGTIAATTITTLTATDVNTGNVDGIIGADTARAGTFTTLNITSMGSGWTNAGNTIANLGTVTTATSITSTDLIGTNVDGILGADTARAITGTTIDATTDFTIDGLVITADTISNDATLTIDGAVDIALSADGGNVTMDDGTTTIFDFNTDDPEIKIHDDAQVANYASIAVGASGATTISTVDADAAIAHLTLDADGDINLDPIGGGKIVLDGTINVDAGVVTGATSITSTAFVGGLTGAATGLTGTPNIACGTISGTTITAATGLVPDANDGAYLGQGGTGFSDLYLANLGEIDWNNGQVAIKNLTHGDQYALLVGGSGTITSLAVTGHVTASNHIKALGDIYALGDVVAYYSSDERLKDNLQVIEGSLDKIGQISGYEFDWNEDAPGWAKERGHDVGVIAQEVQKVLPEVVQERKNGYLGVDYKRIVPLLIESIKELKEEVEILKKKVN